MESMASPNPFSATPTKPSTQTASKPSLSFQIETPEKPIEKPRRAKSRSVAFSVKKVKQIALGLQKTDKKPTDLKILSGSGNDLMSTEDQIGADFSTSRVRKPSKGKSPVKLPERYEMLHKFFHFLETSIRLLRLRGKMPNFSNICPMIECLTDRRFTYGHLSQIKYIMSEAISIKKVLFHDEKTCCMKPDLQITLQVDPFSKNREKNRSGSSILSKIFRDNLVKFSEEHPEEESIPEAALPDPFNQIKLNIVAKLNNSTPASTSSSPIDSSYTVSQQQLAVPSHMPPFQRMFSRKALMSDITKTPASCDNASMEGGSPSRAISSLTNVNSKPTVSKDSSLWPPIQLPLGSGHVTNVESRKSAKVDCCSPKEMKILEGTPAKLISTQTRMMTATPELRTPKRCHQIMDNDHTSAETSMRRPTRTKLFPTPVKKAKVNVEVAEVLVDGAILILPKTVLQSVREKEKKAVEDREAGAAEAKRRQQMICCLPKLFDMILLLFQSLKCSVITKQELVHKIIAGHFDIIDRSEVEEQLQLLQELVPDWISGKATSSGDFLIRINKAASPGLMRQALAEVVQNSL